MKLLDVHETILVVTGADDSGAPRDRPLALSLQREIDTRGAGHTYRRAVVLADDEFLDRPGLHVHPTIAIGGPGVNAVTRHFLEDLPTVWQEEERVFVQVDIGDAHQRVALWGVDSEATSNAAEAFVSRGFLDHLLERIWRLRAGFLT